MLSTLSQLATLAADALPSDHVVAEENGADIRWHELHERALAKQEQLRHIAQPSILMHHSDTLELLASLLATWSLGKTAVLPANTQGAHLQSLLQADKMPAQADFNIGLTLNASNSALVIYTSGSSGQPKAIAKTLQQLESEIQTLDKAWQQTVAGGRFICTVNRHHMYGLPFSLLWPLCAGNPIATANIRFLESLENLAQKPFVLISSPAQLSKLPAAVDWPTISRHCLAVYSAGAVLPTDAATLAQEKLGCQISEIYGSTESGAVATRQRPAEQHWQALPDTQIAIDDESKRLSVRSGAASTSGEWLSLDDRAKPTPEGRFELLGRLDRIVKVAGKRISLSQLEQLLKQHPLVADARCIQLAERNGRIGAAICLNENGNLQLTDQGRQAINRELSETLSEQVDPVARPRYWRYLSELPHNQMGKLDSAALQCLFVPQQQPTMADVIDQQQQQNDVQLRLYIPPQLRYFNGHFPGNPILPGVVQLLWAQKFCHQFFPQAGTLDCVELVKFQQVIRPSMEVTLHLQWQPEKNKATFRYSSESCDHSNGRIRFTP